MTAARLPPIAAKLPPIAAKLPPMQVTISVVWDKHGDGTAADAISTLLSFILFDACPACSNADSRKVVLVEPANILPTGVGYDDFYYECECSASWSGNYDWEI